jgi:hypothetical protein
MKKPNVSGKDRFVFLSCPAAAESVWCAGKDWCTYRPTGANTREALMSRCKSSGSYCSALLEYDNWEFKDDYPYNL